MEPERRDQLIWHGRDPEGNETVWEGESKILAKIREREPDYRPIFYPNIQSIPQNFSAAPPED